MDNRLSGLRIPAIEASLLVLALMPSVVRGQGSPSAGQSDIAVISAEPDGQRSFQPFPRVTGEPRRNDALGHFFHVESPEVDAKVQSAMALLGHSNYGQAWTPINDALEAEPGRKNLYVIRAFLRCMLMKAGDANALAWAEDDLSRASYWPEDGFPAGVKGCIAERRGQHQLALDHFSWAINHGAALDDFLVWRAFALMKLNKWREAIPDLDRVAHPDPANFRAVEYLEVCHKRLGEWKQAMGDMDRNLKLRPRNVPTRFGRLTLALEHQQYDVALDDLEVLAVQRPELSFALLYLRSVVLWATGKDIAQARAELDRAIECEPREWTMHVFRAFLDHKESKYAAALGDLVLGCLAMNHETFSIYGNLEPREDGTWHFMIGVRWKLKRGEDRPKGAAEAEDLKHKLADLSLKTLWVQACR